MSIPGGLGVGTSVPTSYIIHMAWTRLTFLRPVSFHRIHLLLLYTKHRENVAIFYSRKIPPLRSDAILSQLFQEIINYSFCFYNISPSTCSILIACPYSRLTLKKKERASSSYCIVFLFPSKSVLCLIFASSLPSNSVPIAVRQLHFTTA